MELVFIVRDQEVGGSNPLAPTNSLESATYSTRKSEERLVQGQDIDASSPLATTILSPLRSIRYAGIRNCEFYFILRTTRTTAVVLFGIWKPCLEMGFLVGRLTVVGSEIS